MPVDLFSLDPPSSLLGRAALGVARPLLTRVLGVSELARLHHAIRGGGDEGFPARALDVLHIEVSDGSSLGSVPATGPLIVAANHPHGILDGLALATLVRRVRPDARLVANHLLARIPELQSLCFFVDPFDGPAAAARSLAGLRAAHLWLRQGGALILFPAGSVASSRTGDRAPVDDEWITDLGRLADRSGAAVVPAFIAGSNSRLFYAAGRIHPLLRTVLLPRELLRKRRSRVSVTFGATLSPARDAGRDAAARLTMETRVAVDRLSAAHTTGPCCHATRIPHEIAALPPAAHLVQGGDFDVYVAAAAAMPSVLIEIGRLRAEAYRAVGEGTGTDLDLDAFDEYYLHLFAWDRRRQQIAGAYRIGRVDQIVDARGVEGLYTRTLFDYGREFIRRLPPALELGRSFVTFGYQKHHQPLLLLWRGIGQFVVKHPQYRVLFGPVSISPRYCDASHELLKTFLTEHHLDAALAGMVRPAHPRPASPALPRETHVPASAADADRIVATLEPDGKGMPVLLRQYLKLKARAIAFSVDPDFGGVLDALMAVDLLHVDRALLQRYLGDNADQFVRQHADRQHAAA